MLGRHGDNLFWMARYLERSENLSRRIQATLHYALSREDEGEEEDDVESDCDPVALEVKENVAEDDDVTDEDEVAVSDSEGDIVAVCDADSLLVSDSLSL